MTKFYLGTHMPRTWLKHPWLTEVPLFVSRTRLEARPGVLLDVLPTASTDWAMDSGGFWEITHRGGWAFTAEQYATEIRRARDEIGRLQWAAPMDWMCEPAATHKTGLTITEHQRRTVANFVELRSMVDEVIPCIQGLALSDYLRCVDLYEQAGVDLTLEPVVGLGSVCRRQHTSEIAEIVLSLQALDLRLHGFGVKHEGLAKYAHGLVSADSLAWSTTGRWEGNKRRRSGRGPGCEHRRPDQKAVLNEGNCMSYALNWRDGVLKKFAEAA